MNITNNCTSHKKIIYTVHRIDVILNTRISKSLCLYHFLNCNFSSVVKILSIWKTLEHQFKNYKFSVETYFCNKIKINCCQVRKLQLNKRLPRCQIWLTCCVSKKTALINKLGCVLHINWTKDITIHVLHMLYLFQRKFLNK